MPQGTDSTGVAPKPDPPPTKRPSRLTAWLKWTRVELDSNLDTDLAIGPGVIIGVLGILQVTSLEVTAGLVLVELQHLQTPCAATARSASS